MADDHPQTPAGTPDHTAPPQPQTPVQKSEPAAQRQPVKNLEMKAILLLVFTLGLILGTAVYLLQARGLFEPKQKLVLIADNAEGMAAGMDLTFSGFPIGTVRDFQLGDAGNVRVNIEVRKRDAKWLRTSSIFTLEKGLLGPVQLRAFSGILTDPPLPDGAERPVLRGDFNTEIQRTVGAAREVLDNLNEMTVQGSEINRALADLHVFTTKLQSRQGALHAIFGNEADARKLVVTIERANAALARVETLMRTADRTVGNVDKLVVNADRQVFGAQGLAAETRGAIQEAHKLLQDARNSMQRVDTVLRNAEGITGNVNEATQGLGALRADVEANLRKIEDMINDLNRKWPFAKDREVQLP
jgi:phospholipid/cholesterol/gamma-HCH transport system substrate-binding protein